MPACAQRQRQLSAACASTQPAGAHGLTTRPPSPCVQRSKLHYFYGRGLGEAARFALGAAGADWEDCFVRERADMLKLLGERDSATGNKTLMFEQLPLLIMPDGTQVVQGQALIRHIGRSFGMYGETDAESTRIDMLLGGIGDFGNKCPGWPSPDSRAGLPKLVEELESKWLGRYGGAFEQQLSEVNCCRPRILLRPMEAVLTMRLVVRLFVIGRLIAAGSSLVLRSPSLIQLYCGTLRSSAIGLASQRPCRC